MFKLNKSTKTSIILLLGSLIFFTFTFLLGNGGNLAGCIIFSIPAQVLFSSAMIVSRMSCVSKKEEQQRRSDEVNSKIGIFEIKQSSKISIILFFGGLMTLTFSFLYGICGNLAGCIIFSVPTQVLFLSAMMVYCIPIGVQGINPPKNDSEKDPNPNN